MYNNDLIEEDQLYIPVKDHGFMYGMGLFETFRVYNNEPFLFDEHLERLSKGLNLLGILINISTKEWKSKLLKLLRVNQLTDAYIRLTVTAGVAPIGLPQNPYHEPLVLWMLKPIQSFQEDLLFGKK
ncbi:aminotransferase class IV [Tepidibacillus marianensis]|uniref:aminotransferase class IV n=1 Tax=Tepidibacillus marianensis TaxID=3131995 RepID=UPI0030CCA376